MISLDLFLIPGPDGIDQTLEFVHLAEDEDFRCLWIADSQSLGWWDIYATMGVLSTQTSRISLASGVTNPLTRHPSVTANAMRTIHELSGGRAVLGIGVGDSAVRNIGNNPATIKQLIEAVDGIRKDFIKWNVSIPIYISATGPKYLHEAAKLGDGILVHAGTHPSIIRRVLADVDSGAREVGKLAKDIDVAFMSGFCVDSDHSEAVRQVRPAAARRAKDMHYHPETLPVELEHLRGQAQAVAEQYDYKEHEDPNAAHNRLVTEALVDAYSLAGTPDECVAKIRSLEEQGVRRLVLFPVGKDRYKVMKMFVDEVVPRLRAI